MHCVIRCPEKIQTKYSLINNDMHRASIISSDMDSEIGVIQKKYTHADYPKRYVESVIKQLNEKTRSHQRENVTNEQQKHLF